MTPFLRLVKKTAEKALGKYYEGPQAPRRLEQQVAVWAKAHPQATRREWAEYASRISSCAYEEGWERGYQWAERDLDSKPQGDPDRVAEELAQLEAWDPAKVPEVEEGEVPDVEELSQVDEEGAQHVAYSAWIRSQAAMGPRRKM